VGTNSGVDHQMLNSINNRKIVFVDGEDHQGINLPSKITPRSIFKRELPKRSILKLAIHPLPFSAEKRYFSNAEFSKKYLVSFVANLNTNPVRLIIHNELIKRKSKEIFSGNTGETAYNASTSNYLTTPTYNQILNSSLISINAPGGGQDCARFWEILASGAMLLTYRLDLTIPNSFVEDYDYVTFRTMEELNKKIDFYLANPEA
jgi:hypothetical protein